MVRFGVGLPALPLRRFVVNVCRRAREVVGILLHHLELGLDGADLGTRAGEGQEEGGDVKKKKRREKREALTRKSLMDRSERWLRGKDEEVLALSAKGRRDGRGNLWAQARDDWLHEKYISGWKRNDDRGHQRERRGPGVFIFPLFF